LGALLFAMAMSLLAGQSAGATPTDNGSSQPLVPVLIKFHSNASAADIDDAIHGNGGIVTNDLKQIRTKVVHVPANARDRILAALAQHPADERATAPIELARAGAAGANMNDGIGMAGAAYAGTDPAAVQVLQADGTGYDSDVVAGVLWAADSGASIMLTGCRSADSTFARTDAIADAGGRSAVP